MFAQLKGIKQQTTGNCNLIIRVSSITRHAHIQTGEVVDDGAESLADVLLGELHLPHVKWPNAADLVPGVDDCRGFALGRTKKVQ